MRNIWKVGKRKNRQFENVIKLSKHGDVIFLPPGEYHFLDGFNIKNLTIKGLGKSPNDVIIHGFFAVHNNSTLKLANVTLHAPHNHNALNIKKGSTVHLHKVIIHGEMTGDYPAIWCEGSKITIRASEIYFSEERDGGIHLSKSSEAKISYAILDSITSQQSKIHLRQCQIRVALTLTENTLVNGKEIIDFPGSGNLFAIYMTSGARANFDYINVDEKDVHVSLDHAF